MTDDQIIKSFLADPPVKPEPNPAAARHSVRRVTELTQDRLYPLQSSRARDGVEASSQIALDRPVSL